MIISGLSGNEIYCLHQKGYAPGRIVVGNSVYSLGAIRSLTSGIKTFTGGEIHSLTELISDGRHAAISRLEKESSDLKANGVTGVTSELKRVRGLHEFLAIGTSIHTQESPQFFTTACSGQDLYCQIDAGYEPRHFVIGNVCYALGVGRGLMGMVRTFAGGEVKEYSDMYNHTRHLALERLEAEAALRGANAVVDITTRILPFGPGVREMLMVGTASYNPALGQTGKPVTSELTGEELWNLTSLGYQPIRLMLGSSVYALGVGGGISTFFKSFARGEVNAMTKLVYSARENALEHIHREATQLQADGIIGVKIFIYEVGGGMVEVMAIGTAIKRSNTVKTHTEQLPPQAIIRDRDTFFDQTHAAAGNLGREQASAASSVAGTALEIAGKFGG
jgi:uncharacterized protein YbjQ (UPF0145 family)